MQGRLYPNGEFTVSTLDNKRFRPDRPHPKESQEEASWNSLVAAHVEMFGVLETIGVVQQVVPTPLREGMLDVLVGLSDDEGSIGLSNVPNSRQDWKSSLRGQRGITSYARRLVRNAAYGLEKQHDKSTLSFLTLTLPSLPGSEFKVFMRAHWSRCTKLFTDWLAARLKRANLPKRWVGVTEIQMKRFYETGLPVPHLHFVFVGRAKFGGWLVTPLEVRNEWVRILKSTGLPAFQNPLLDWRAVENIQRVEKSVEAYLGKYLSKGVSINASIGLREWHGYLPSNWHFISQDLKDWVKYHTISGEGVGRVLLVLCESADIDWIQWATECNIPWGDIKLQVGFAGRIWRHKLLQLQLACRRQKN